MALPSELEEAKKPYLRDFTFVVEKKISSLLEQS
jgi:hypothetical protein